MTIDKIMIPYSELQKKGVKNSTSFILYGIIYYHSYTYNTTWISDKTLAIEMNITERQVKNCVNDLKMKECIEIYNDQENPKIRYIKPIINMPLEYRKKETNKRKPIEPKYESEMLFHEAGENDEQYNKRLKELKERNRIKKQAYEKALKEYEK